ncbi:MAG: hypothetical protein ACHQAY_24035 [Hyphomicrobiales bacterium]
MATAITSREQSALDNPETVPGRREVLARYLHLRAISKQHHSKILDFLSMNAALDHARRLGLAVGKTFIADDMDDLTYAWDLAIHTAPNDRSRAIDRYARAARLAPGSDEALVLEAMRQARFAVVRVERRHETVGLIVRDLMRGMEVWLVDQGAESSAPDGYVMATRLFAPETFSMAAGVQVPLGRELIEEALDSLPQWHHKTPAEVADDRRFAEAIYRVALAAGVTRNVTYRDAVPEED